MHLNTCQHGFLAGKSCATNIEGVDQISWQLDDRGQTNVIHFDIW